MILDKLPQACAPPLEQDIINFLQNIKLKERLNGDTLTYKIMAHFRGICNPSIARKIVSEYLYNGGL